MRNGLALGRYERIAAVLLVTGTTLAGCGYALVGKGVTTDPSIKRVGVPLFKDRTGRRDLDQKITLKVIEELQKRGRFTVVQEEVGVDAVVASSRRRSASRGPRDSPRRAGTPSR